MNSLDNAFFRLSITGDFQSDPHYTRLTLRFISHGSQQYIVDGNRKLLKEGACLLMNNGQEYRIRSEGKNLSVMVGMAFNPAFYSACLYSRLFPNDFFPEQADQGLSYSFTEGIHTPTEKLAIVSNLIQKGTLLDHNHNKAAIQELFIHIIDELFHMDDKLSRQLANVQPIKAATRKELMRKLKIAIDYMDACPQEIPDIASVANAATLSEFHFYRLFKKAFKIPCP